MTKIITTTSYEIPGKKISKILGVAKGNTIRARHVGRDVMAGLKNLIGIIGIRYSTSMIMQGAAEMLAYGTAVKLK